MYWFYNDMYYFFIIVFIINYNKSVSAFWMREGGLKEKIITSRYFSKLSVITLIVGNINIRVL